MSRLLVGRPHAPPIMAGLVLVAVSMADRPPPMPHGSLARRTGSIVPGMVIHVLGDLAHTHFGLLRGDASLLFVR